MIVSAPGTVNGGNLKDQTKWRVMTTSRHQSIMTPAQVRYFDDQKAANDYAAGFREQQTGEPRPKTDADWQSFQQGTGTLGIPRAEMPQIRPASSITLMLT